MPLRTHQLLTAFAAPRHAIAAVASLVIAFAICAPRTLAQAPAPAPTGSLAPTESQVLTLEALEKRALETRPLLEADAARVRAAAADVRRAESAYSPVLGLEAETAVGPGRELIEIPHPDDGDPILVSGARPLGESGAFDPSIRYGAGLELRATLYDFGRTRAAVSASRAARAAQEASREVTAARIVRQVRRAYLSWLLASELLSVATRARDDAGERKKRVQALIAEGMRPQSDLAPARSDELLATLESERARGQLERSRRALELAVGAKLPEDSAPDRGLLELSTPASHDDPEGRALELSLRAAHASAEAHEHAHGPVLAGSARAGAQAQDDSVFPTYGAAITFQLPLWDGGADSAAADAARARAEAIAAEQREHAAARTHAAAEAQHEAEHARVLLETAESLLESCKGQLAEAEARVQLQGGSLEPIASARAMVRKAESEVVLAKITVAQALLNAGQ